MITHNIPLVYEYHYRILVLTPYMVLSVLSGKNKVRKRAVIRNRYNQALYLTKDTNGKVTTSQLDITNESQEVRPFPAGDYKTSINRRKRKHNKNKTEIT